MKAMSAVKSGAVATEPEIQFAQVGTFESARLYGPGASHWGSASFGLAVAFEHVPEAVAESARVKCGYIEFKV